MGNRKYAAAYQRATMAQRREMLVYGFDHWCEGQRERILRAFTDTTLDRDLPIEQVEAKWLTTRLGPELTWDEKCSGVLQLQETKS